MNSGGQLPWGTRRPTHLDGPGRGGGYGRIVVMAVILVGLIAAAWFAWEQLSGSPCNEGYCERDLGVGAPSGFAFVSEAYAWEGEQPAIPEGGTIEIEIPLTQDVRAGSDVQFYRFIEDSSAWEVVGPASVNAEAGHAVGSFDRVPETIVIMQRNTPAGRVAGYLEPGDAVHTSGVEHLTVLHTRDFRPAGDGTIEGDLTPLPEGMRADHHPVIEAGDTVDGTLPALDAILAESSTRTAHVQHIVELATSLGVAGINIDYAGLREDQRLSFGLLIEELDRALDDRDILLSLTLPPPQVGPEQVNTGAYDWEVLGGAADFINLEPIRNQATFREDLSAILEHLDGLMPLQKLNLGITPYAAENSQDGMRPLTLAEAMTIATRISVDADEVATNENVEVRGLNIDTEEGLSGILWEEATGAVAFTYKDDGGRTVWLENFFSVGFKLEYVDEYGLGGFAVEDASDDPFLGDIWSGIVPYAQAGEPVLSRPNATDLEPRWEVSGGSLEGGQSGVAIWTTPSEPGTYTVSLTLSDGVHLFENQVSVNVVEREEPGNGDQDGG